MKEPDWEPTSKLRYARMGDCFAQLQQVWIRGKLDPFGHVCGYEQEWRDVPFVSVELPKES